MLQVAAADQDVGMYQQMTDMARILREAIRHPPESHPLFHVEVSDGFL